MISIRLHAPDLHGSRARVQALSSNLTRLPNLRLADTSVQMLSLLAQWLSMRGVSTTLHSNGLKPEYQGLCPRSIPLANLRNSLPGDYGGIVN